MEISAETAVVGLGIALTLWWLGASIFNRRRGIAVYRWLHAGLDALGEDISGRWIGSSGSGAQLVVRKAKPPFREAQIIYLLASRELLPLFLLDILRGKRDRLIFKGTLRANPASELEVVSAASGLARQMRDEKGRPWTITDGPHGLLIGGRGASHEALRAACLPLLEKHGQHVIQMSWANKTPHLIAILSLTELFQARGPAADLYADLTAMAEKARPAPAKKA